MGGGTFLVSKRFQGGMRRIDGLIQQFKNIIYPKECVSSIIEFLSRKLCENKDKQTQETVLFWAFSVLIVQIFCCACKTDCFEI